MNRHLLAGRLREAIAQLEQAPASHATLHDLAVALRARGDIGRALACAQEALTFRTSAPTLALIASLHALHGDRTTAIATLHDALRVDPAHAVSRYCLGVLLASSDRSAALAQLSQAIASPRLPASVRERARLQLCELLATDDVIPANLCSVPMISELVAVRSSLGEYVEARPAPVVDTRVVPVSVDDARADPYSAIGGRVDGRGHRIREGLATRKELWQRHDRDRAVSVVEFRRDPLPLWTVIREFLGDGALVPNAAHRALAQLPLAGIVTQNVEGLHQAAGSSCPVLELHGTLLETRCEQCGARGSSCVELIRGAVPPACACGAPLRPDVVLFGEWVDPALLARAASLVAACDVLLVVGTAADVAPAADLPLLAAARGATVLEIKRTPSRLGRAGIHHLAGTAEDILPRLVR